MEQKATVHDQGHPQGALLIWTTVGVMIAVCLVLGPAIRYAIHYGRDLDPTANDAKVGTRIALPALDYRGRAYDAKKPTLLVFGGACSGCSLESVHPMHVENAPFEQVVFVYVASARQIRAELGESSARALIFPDPQGLIGERLGATSAPRFYILENGALEEIWKNVHEKPSHWLGRKL